MFDLPQLLERSRKTGVDGSDGEVERVRDLRRRHADPVAQDDNHAPLERERRNRREEAAVSHLVDRREVGHVGKLLVRKPPLRAQEIERAVGDDPVQPRPERTALVEAVKCGEGPLESVRGHVVRQRAATGDRERSAPRIAPVAAKERRSRFSVAASRPPYEVPVTGFTHSSAVLYERAAFARPARGILPG